MQIEALLFVNWIFWMAISAGTILVVGMAELTGGTTRGYRLFMAALLVVFAATTRAVGEKCDTRFRLTVDAQDK